MGRSRQWLQNNPGRSHGHPVLSTQMKRVKMALKDLRGCPSPQETDGLPARELKAAPKVHLPCPGHCHYQQPNLSSPSPWMRLLVVPPVDAQSQIPLDCPRATDFLVQPNPCLCHHCSIASMRMSLKMKMQRRYHGLFQVRDPQVDVAASTENLYLVTS